MLNSQSIQKVDRSIFSRVFRKPLYASYCFSRIPATIYSLFTNNNTDDMLPPDVLGSYKNQYSKIVFILVDSFGWSYFEKYKDKHPALQRFIRKGVVSKLTSQFPSTTPVHVTTINTGLSVGESGVYEWFYYEPQLDAVIAPLLFSYAGDQDRETLRPTGIDPQQLFPTRTLYSDLSASGIASYVFLPAEFAYSSYNRCMTTGVTQMTPFISIGEGLVLLTQAIIQEQQRAYYYFYYGKIDSMGHMYGPDSPQVEAEVDVFFTALERQLLTVLDGKVADTLLLISADHGQAAIDPHTTMYINNVFPQITKYLKTTHQGRPIIPAGSCRDMFLHVNDASIDEVMSQLGSLLKDRALVRRTSELIQEGFFGDTAPSQVFLSRVGNVAILPFQKESVWWYEKDIFEQKNFGHHGGLTPDEMDIPFMALPFVR